MNQTADHGYILGGSSISNISGDKTENMIGGYDMWMVKTDSAGNVQWENTIGGDEGDGIESLEQTSDGGYIVGGTSHSGISGDKTEPLYGAFGSSDYWIVKTDAAGNIQWQNTIGGIDFDNFSSIEQTIGGDYITIGKSRSDISVDKTEMSFGVWDYWIVKMDPSGNIIWQKTIGGSGWDEVPVMREVADGRYIIGGTSYSNRSGDKSEDCMGPTDIWVLKITDKYNTVTGKLFIDPNSNNTQDAGELSAANRQVTEINTGRITFSKPNGTYSLFVLDSGNYTFETALNYYNPVPASHNVYFSGMHQLDSLNDFAFQLAGAFNDLCITITPLSRFRSGSTATYMLSYENRGTTTLSPTVIFFPDSNLTFVSSNPVASAATTDSVVWNVSPIVPFQTGSILVSVSVDLAATLGTIINAHVRIEPVAGDANTTCNYSDIRSIVTQSFDPNVILVDRDTVLTTELSNPPYLDYIIFFQNTGNDTAFNVRVLNNLPLESDVSSFEFIASSDPVNITYGAHSQLMTFAFDNIQLPDSNINEPESHGFVRYRIKPKTTLAAGDHIPNTAFIHFDFNDPVQTNTAVTEIVLPTGMEGLRFKVQGLRLYPNPTKEILVIESSLLSNEKNNLKIADLTGRVIFSQHYSTGNHTGSAAIDISGFSQGVYLVQLESGGRISIGKFAVR